MKMQFSLLLLVASLATACTDDAESNFADSGTPGDGGTPGSSIDSGASMDGSLDANIDAQTDTGPQAPDGGPDATTVP